MMMWCSGTRKEESPSCRSDLSMTPSGMTSIGDSYIDTSSEAATCDVLLTVAMRKGCKLQEALSGDGHALHCWQLFIAAVLRLSALQLVLDLSKAKESLNFLGWSCP